MATKTKTAPKAKKAPQTKHKPNCPGLNQEVKLVPDHNRKMLVCSICAVPDSTPEMAKTAYKMIEAISKAGESFRSKVKKAPKAAPKAVKTAPKAAPVEATAAAEEAPAPKVEGETAS